MLRIMMKSKLHRAIVTEANLHYVGSVTIDEDLMDLADIYPNEQVQIVNVNNGSRFETYVIAGERGSGNICVNGAAARLVHEGDIVIIIAYGLIENGESKKLKPKVVVLGERNVPTGLIAEIHGTITGNL
ncbi:aspartate 1-decarboxylase [Paenibacillus glucanolyticus]|uniref:aspartate 1-decarboxylase n=1 Tax=Paenibacillus glucanolyticus TaxID=59843 RepID=UPI0036B2D4D0